MYSFPLICPNSPINIFAFSFKFVATFFSNFYYTYICISIYILISKHKLLNPYIACIFLVLTSLQWVNNWYVLLWKFISLACIIFQLLVVLYEGFRAFKLFLFHFSIVLVSPLFKSHLGSYTKEIFCAVAYY